MKPRPTSSTHAATCSGPRSIFTPRASSTSALPHALEAARLPCLATRAPAAAAAMADTVEMLKLFDRSPPVPHVSIAPSVTRTWTAAARRPAAKPAISSTVSPRTARAARSAPSWAAVASPAITEAMALSASSRLSVRPAATAPSASRVSMHVSQEVAEDRDAVGGEHRFRVELHRIERQAPMAQAHDDAVIAPRADLDRFGKRRRVDHQRVVPGRDGRIQYAGEDPAPVVSDHRRLPVPRLGSAHDAGAERHGHALEAEADAQGPDPPLRRAAYDLRRSAGDLGPARSGRDDHPVGLAGQDGLQRRIVRTHHLHVGAKRSERLGEVEGEGVVVVDEEHPGHRSTAEPSTSSIARSSARAFARHSASSDAGSESATMPAPAWMRQTPSARRAVRIAMQVSSEPSKPR